MRLDFPYKGVHKGRAGCDQPKGTSPDLKNVRPYDTLDKRIRGGQRPGIDKLFSQQIGGAAKPIIDMCTVTVVN